MQKNLRTSFFLYFRLTLYIPDGVCVLKINGMEYGSDETGSDSGCDSWCLPCNNMPGKV